MRDGLFRTCIELLEVSGMLYSTTYIQWGGMVFVLSELCARPYSPECNRAWDCITTKASGDEEDESRLALWRPIRRLIAKARYVREMQRTDRGRPVQADQKAQYYDPIPCPPAAEFLSHYPRRRTLTLGTQHHNPQCVPCQLLSPRCLRFPRVPIARGL
ncbi:hypothetical protein N7449_009317 [Penicillium cf. viridicatum]|uniref:Uncharacterized protein n=1 Tax=Penicillium cf. viridicatum TaxID=2972119 RepID=A0A9W9JA50_9EURO|nr:hypothetical protein N7449_009317 [Penicillium cf. viridicatum]